MAKHGSWRRFRMAHKKALSRESKVSWAGGAQSRGGLLSGVALRAIRFTLGDTQSATGRYCVTNMRTLQGTELSGTEKETLWCPIPKYQLWVQVDHETPFLMFTSSLVVDQWKQWLLYLFVGPLGEPTSARSAVFLNIVQKAFDPPPSFWTLCCKFFLMDFLKSA